MTTSASQIGSVRLMNSIASSYRERQIVCERTRYVRRGVVTRLRVTSRQSSRSALARARRPRRWRRRAGGRLRCCSASIPSSTPSRPASVEVARVVVDGVHAALDRADGGGVADHRAQVVAHRRRPRRADAQQRARRRRGSPASRRSSRADGLDHLAGRGARRGGAERELARAVAVARELGDHRAGRAGARSRAPSASASRGPCASPRGCRASSGRGRPARRARASAGASTPGASSADRVLALPSSAQPGPAARRRARLAGAPGRRPALASSRPPCARKRAAAPASGNSQPVAARRT